MPAGPGSPGTEHCTGARSALPQNFFIADTPCRGVNLTGVWYGVDMSRNWDHTDADDLLSSTVLGDGLDDRWLMVCLYPKSEDVGPRIKIHAVKNPDEFLMKGYKREDFLPVASILGDMFRFEMATGLTCNRFYPVANAASILRNAKTDVRLMEVVGRHSVRLGPRVAAGLLITWGIATGQLEKVAA